MFLAAEFRNCFQEIRLRLLQLGNESPMAVASNRFASVYIVQERISMLLIDPLRSVRFVVTGETRVFRRLVAAFEGSLRP
jgi:hypothetical protein